MICTGRPRGWFDLRTLELIGYNRIFQKDCLSELCKSTIALADFYRSINELEQRNNASSPASLESTPTPTPARENKASDILIEESDSVDENSLESTPTPTPVPEVETSHVTARKFVRYTSDGKLAPSTN